MKKINIWIFQTGEPLPTEDDSRGMRLSNLYKKAKGMGEKVLVIIEIQTGKYLGEDDIIRFEDKYGR